ncbi:unnamed protein product [Orchesella dallaii]|uniref:Uncharacterized protein n=1 Tax=Orchesella dallaii TaxID=48710 RepID=A0ABP1QQI0_9HEXA
MESKGIIFAAFLFVALLMPLAYAAVPRMPMQPSTSSPISIDLSDNDNAVNTTGTEDLDEEETIRFGYGGGRGGFGGGGFGYIPHYHYNHYRPHRPFSRPTHYRKKGYFVFLG